MFRRIILFTIIFFPVWYSLFIGYPVISDNEYQAKIKEHPGISISKRCFGVGEFREFTKCLSTSERLSGIALFNEITGKTNRISPFITTIIFFSLTLFVILSGMWIRMKR